MKELQELKLWILKYSGDGRGESLDQIHRLTCDAFGSRVDYIPENIDKLENLRFFYLNHNLLTSIPESIGKLRYLTSLVLSHNQLTSLPASICELKNLTSLFISENPNLILTQKQANFISRISNHSDLSEFTIIPDTELAKDLFL